MIARAEAGAGLRRASCASERKECGNMPLPIPLAVALFLTIWWVVLFAILPIGIRSQHEAGDFVAGTDPGAPVRPRIMAKALWTTLVSLVVFGLLLILIRLTR